MAGLIMAATMTSSRLAGRGVHMARLEIERSAKVPYGGMRCAEQDAGSVGGASNAIDARNQGQLAGTAVVRSFGQRLDDGMEFRPR